MRLRNLKTILVAGLAAGTLSACVAPYDPYYDNGVYNGVTEREIGVYRTDDGYVFRSRAERDAYLVERERMRRQALRTGNNRVYDDWRARQDRRLRRAERNEQIQRDQRRQQRLERRQDRLDRQQQTDRQTRRQERLKRQQRLERQARRQERLERQQQTDRQTRRQERLERQQQTDRQTRRQERLERQQQTDRQTRRQERLERQQQLDRQSRRQDRLNRQGQRTQRRQQRLMENYNYDYDNFDHVGDRGAPMCDSGNGTYHVCGQAPNTAAKIDAAR